MSLDQFASTVGTMTLHPRGEFVGVVDSVKREETKNGAKIICVYVKTNHGNAPKFTLGYVNEDDFSRAKFQLENGDGGPLDKIKTIISMTKNFLLRMGLVNKDVIDSLGYTQCIKELPKLIGKKVKVQVVEQKNNPQYNQTNLSKYEEEEVNNSTTPNNGYSLDDIPF